MKLREEDDVDKTLLGQVNKFANPMLYLATHAEPDDSRVHDDKNDKWTFKEIMMSVVLGTLGVLSGIAFVILEIWIGR